MIIQHRFLLLIYTLCYVAIIHGYLLDINDAETCNLLCGQCNATSVFANGLCECSFTDDNNEDADCIQRIQKEIQAIDLNTLSDDSTDEERNVRSTLRRRRLRMGDADKVAQYFINGGPAAGHFHFIKAFNETYNSADSAKNSFSGAVDESSPENGFRSASLIHPISRSTCDSPLYLVLGNADNRNDEENAYGGYASSIETPNPNVYPLTGLYGLTNSLLGAISHPHRTHEHGLHHVLLRTAALPAHALHNLLVRPHHHHHHHHPFYHHNIRSAYPTVSHVGQQLPRCSGSVHPSAPSVAMSNANKPEHNIATPLPTAIDQVQYSNPYVLYNYDTNVPPVQYQSFGHPYRYVYQNPIFKVLYPITDNYYVPPNTNIQNPMISAPNPYHYCINNANTEQPSTVPTFTDNPLLSNNEAEKSNDAIKTNISHFQKEKKTEKDGNNKL